ncbi:MAG: DNA polymerase III subunit beta [Acidimicrobiales bacterium]
MRFRAEKEQLVDALALTSRAAATRGAPALTGVRMEVAGSHLRLVGTDLDLTVRAGLEVSASTDGVCVVPARLAADVVRSLEPGAVSVVLEESELTISGGRSRFALRCLAAEEFLRSAEAEADPVTVDAAALAGALGQVVKAASKDETRPVLTGVLLSAEPTGLRLVATDSYRLAVRDLPGTTVLAEGQRVLVPARALGELARILSGAAKVEVSLGRDEASFDVGGVRLTTRLIEGDFPNYQQLIPTGVANRLVVARSELLDAVRRVKLLAREATPVRLTMGGEHLEMTAVTQDVGEAREELDAEYEGSPMTVAFNPDFLIEGVEAVGSDEVCLEAADPLKPATIRPIGSTEFLYLLMPVRV